MTRDIKDGAAHAELELRVADYADPGHGAAILALLDSYARDPMGGGKGLAPAVQERLLAGLATFPGALTVLAFSGSDYVGLVNAFPGFSTFAARPLLNIHDVVVAPPFRRRGIASAMLQRVEVIARERGCCKLTLEVLAGNGAAQEAYRKLGFAGYALDPEKGQAQFWEKTL